VDKTLTLRIRSRSLVTYARTTLIATRRPSYVPCETSAKPPHSTSTESSEQSGMCMDFGITRCRLHVLQSSLSSFSRSRSDTASFSRRCRPYKPWEGGGVAKLTSFISLTRFWASGSESCRNWKKEATRGRNFPRCCCWLGGENVRYIAESLHRRLGLSCQPVVITLQMGSCNNLLWLESIGRDGRLPAQISVVMSLRLLP